MPKVAAAKKAPAKRPSKAPDLKSVPSSGEEEAPAVWMDLDELVPWAKNPKPHEDVSHIEASMLKFGFGDPMVARKANNEILAGHGRYKAARSLVAKGHKQFKRVPVRLMDLNARDAHLYALAANRLAEKSPWDTPSLQDVMSEYSLPELELAGWDEDDLEKMAKALAGSAGDGDGADDQSDKAKTDFAVLIECDDEQEQLHIIRQCEQLGFKCRALV